MPPPPDYDTTDIDYYDLPSFSFSSGTTLHDVRIAYRSYNASSTAGVVLIPTCYAGFINTTLTFTTPPHDALAAYHVVVVAMLGNGESASPSNKKFFPEAGQLRYEDVVRAQYRLLTEHLHVASLAAVVGFSMGGQQAYHWAVMYPDFVTRVVAICSSARTSLHNYAFLEGPVAALTSAIDYIAWRVMKEKAARGEEVGPNLRELVPKKGLRAFARAYGAWLTSPQWFRDAEFTRGDINQPSVDDWMAWREEGYLSWDAEDLLVLARMWQMGDVAFVGPEASTSQDKESTTPPGKPLNALGGRVPDEKAFIAALARIQARVLLMPCRTDQYFPPEDSEHEMKHLKHGTLRVIESSWGHTAGGGANPPDTQFMNQEMTKFMAQSGGGANHDRSWRDVCILPPES